MAEGSFATAVNARPIPDARAPCAKTEKPAGDAGAAARKKNPRETRMPVDRTRPRLVTFPPAVGTDKPLHAIPRARAKSTTGGRDRKSTRLNSSHLVMSYAVSC